MRYPALLAAAFASTTFVSTIALADDAPPSASASVPAPDPRPTDSRPVAAPPAPPPPSTPIAATVEPVRLEHPRIATTTTTADAQKPLLLPGILAGTGLVLITTGILLAVTAPDTPATCNSDTKTCARLPNQTNESFADDQDRAGRAHTQPIAGWLTVGVGGMFITAGVLSYFMGDRPRRPRVAVSAGPSGGSLSLTMRTF